MYCQNCGEPLSEGSRFCENCGAPVPQQFITEEPPKIEETAPKANNPSPYSGYGSKQGKSKKSYAIPILIVIVVIAVAIVAYFLAPIVTEPTINLNQYIQVSYSGQNGSGTAKVTFDREQFRKDNEEKLEKHANVSRSILFPTYSDLLLDMCVVGNLDKTRGLSNGDKITYKWHVDKEMANSYFDVSLVYPDEVFTVSGLH